MKYAYKLLPTKEKTKKNKTIKLFEKKHLNRGFDTLIIFFTTLSKPKSTNELNFNYIDFSIIEFTGLIENNCNQEELLKIRDILIINNTLPRNSNKTAKKPQSSKVSQREFLRRKKIQKEIVNEVLVEDWHKIDREELAKLPIHKFKDSRFILRSISDESYPNVDENAKWSRTFMYDLYEKGILIWLDAVSGTEALVNEKKEWCVLDYNNKKKEPEKGFHKVKIRILGELPYKNIIHWEDGDGYYNYYHLFCKYD